MKNLVLFGHRGALGQSVEKLFVENGWRGYGVDPSPKMTTSKGLWQVRSLKEIPSSESIEAIICAAGSFELNSSKEASENQLARLWAANVAPAFVAADFAKEKNAKVLILVGARTVYESRTPYALVYGACKAAVHHFAQSLFESEQSLKVFCLLPKVLDTPMNRKNMPKEDFSQWTSTEDVAKKILGLCSTEAYKPNSVFYNV